MKRIGDDEETPRKDSAGLVIRTEEKTCRNAGVGPQRRSTQTQTQMRYARGTDTIHRRTNTRTRKHRPKQTILQTLFFGRAAGGVLQGFPGLARQPAAGIGYPRWRDLVSSTWPDEGSLVSPLDPSLKDYHCLIGPLQRIKRTRKTGS